MVVRLTSGVGHGRRLLFPDVPEGKSGKNRLHVDVHSEPGSLDKLVARLEDLGATRVRDVNKGPAGRWWVMQDPFTNVWHVETLSGAWISLPRRPTSGSRMGPRKACGGSTNCSHLGRHLRIHRCELSTFVDG